MHPGTRGSGEPDTRFLGTGSRFCARILDEAVVFWISLGKAARMFASLAANIRVTVSLFTPILMSKEGV